MDFYITPEEYDRAAANGITARTLEYRIRNQAWDKDRAIITPPRKKVDRSVWRLVAIENGIPLRVFYNRLADGWVSERAATEPLLTKERRSLRMKTSNPTKRVYPQELLDQAKHNGVSRNLFVKRVTKLNWSWERAASEPPISGQECGRRGIQTLKQQRGDVNALIFNRK
ncbi:hypothetical protein D3C74_235880 [compost metagenome]